MTVSKRLSELPASPIRKLVPFATAAKKSGVTVYHLNIGDPDIKTPDAMIDVLKNWNLNPIGYSNSQGQAEFLESLKIYYHRLGFSFIDIANLQITAGGSEGISWAMFATCNPGDEILVFEPFYANYNSYAVVNGVTLVPVRTTIESGFHLPKRTDIEKKITVKTKALLFCNPNNPTGTVYTKDELDMLVDIAKTHNLYLLSDEVYREFTYDGKKQISLLSYMKDLPDKTIVLDSMSKRYSACGLRLGALVSLNMDIMNGVLKIAQGRLAAGMIDQLVASKIVDVPESYFTAVHADYEHRRDVLFEGLSKIPGVTVTKPEGAFYLIVGLPVADSEAFCQWLLTDFREPSTSSGQDETLMIAPAAGFYATKGLGGNEVRIAYVLNANALSRCLVLLANALEQYKKLS